MSDPNESRFDETLPPSRPPAPPGEPPSLDSPETLRPAQPARSTFQATPEPSGSVDLSADTIPPRPDAATSLLAAHGPAAFELLAELGRGAMGVVYKARQRALSRLVALKMILSGGYASQEELDRFRNEAAAIAKLSHPSIVRVYEIGEHDGMPYFAMEYCPGGSLGSLVAGEPLAPRVAARLLASMADGMHHAHQQGIVHRDLKPGNVMVVKLDEAGHAIDGTADLKQIVVEGKGDLSRVALKVADFGLARHGEGSGQTRTGDVLGTPSYMAPEQAAARPDEIGPTADVWALGAILYDLLTGRPPFRGGSAMETVRMVLEREPVELRQMRADVPRDLETICHKCLQKDRGRRYATAKELHDDLVRYLEGHPILARPVGVVEKAARWARRKPALAALSGLLSLALLGLVAGWVAFTLALGKERDKAERHALDAERNAALADENFRMAMGAVDRYFTDVSENALLDEAGMRPLRKALLRDARDFYADFVRTRGEDATLRRELARGHYRLALIDAEMGDLTAAERQFGEALARLAAMPQDAETSKDQASALHHRARVLRTLGRLDDAGARYGEALAVWRALRREADGPEARAGEAATLLGLGNLALARSRYDEAKGHYAEALEARRALAEAAPKDDARQRDLATAWQNLSAAEDGRRDLAASAAALDEAMKIQARLVEQHPRRAKYREDLAVSWFNRGNARRTSGRAAEAVADYDEAAKLLSALAAAHPEVPGYRSKLAAAYLNQAVAMDLTKRPADARRSRAVAVGALRALVKDYPDDPTHRVGLVRAMLNEAFHDPDAANARKELAEAVALLRATKGDNRSLHAEALYNSGVIESNGGEYAEARRFYLEALAALGDPPPAGSLELTARCQSNLGQAARLSKAPADALTWYDRLEATAAALREEKRPSAEGFEQEALRGRGEALEALGRGEEAAARFEALAKRQAAPTRAWTEARRLVALAGSARYEEAARQAEKAAAKAPAGVRYLLARALARAAARAEADDELDEAERARRRDAGRAKALALLAGLAKEGTFAPEAERRRVEGEPDFQALRRAEGWGDVVPRERP